jgi:hypothetical protein
MKSFSEPILPLTDIQQRLATIERTIATIAEQQEAQGTIQHQEALGRLATWRHAQAWLWVLVGTTLAGLVGTLALGGILLMRQPRPQGSMGAEQALAAVDTVLAQAYPSLPKQTQEALNAVYARQGLPSPAQRQPQQPKQ